MLSVEYGRFGRGKNVPSLWQMRVAVVARICRRAAKRHPFAATKVMLFSR